MITITTVNLYTSTSEEAETLAEAMGGVYYSSQIRGSTKEAVAILCIAPDTKEHLARLGYPVPEPGQPARVAFTQVHTMSRKEAEKVAEDLEKDGYRILDQYSNEIRLQRKSDRTVVVVHDDPEDYDQVWAENFG